MSLHSLELVLTHVGPSRETDLARLKRQVERAVGFADFSVGLTLTVGGLGLALYWRYQYGGLLGVQSVFFFTRLGVRTTQIFPGTGVVRGLGAPLGFFMPPPLFFLI